MFAEVVKNIDARMKEYFSSVDIGFTPHLSKLIEIAFDENTQAVDIKTQIPNVDKDSVLILKSLQILKASNV